MTRKRFWSILWLTVALAGFTADAQTNPNLEEGLKPYGSFHGGDIDSVDLTNGNLYVEIPIWSVPQRGKLNGDFRVTFNNKQWQVYSVSGAGTTGPPAWNHRLGHLGMQLQFGQTAFGRCQFRGYIVDPQSGLPAWDPFGGLDCSVTTNDGNVHNIGGSFPSLGAFGFAADGSGIKFLFKGVDGPLISMNAPRAYGIAYDRIGNEYQQATTWPEIVQDANLNTMSFYQNKSVSDTMSRPFRITSEPGGNSYACSSEADTHRVLDSAKTLNIPSRNGSLAGFTFCTVNVPVQSPFEEYFKIKDVTVRIKKYSVTTEHMLQDIVRPDGSRWTFQYNDYGELTKITFPAGGSLSYEYETKPTCNKYMDASIIGAGATPESRVVTSRTLSDQTGSHQWQYVWGAEFTDSATGWPAHSVTVRDPKGDETVHTSIGVRDTCSFYEKETKFYEGGASDSNLPVKVIRTEYTADPDPIHHFTPEFIAANVVPVSETTIWKNGKSFRIEWANDHGSTSDGKGVYPYTFGNITEKREYGTDGKLQRTTITHYKALEDAAYLKDNLLDLVSSIEVQDENSQRAAYTEYRYDEFVPLQPSGISDDSHSAADLLAGPFVCGNLTTEKRQVDSLGTTVQTKKYYYDTGQIYRIVDNDGRETKFYYDTSYKGAYVTSTENAKHQVVAAAYDFNLGKIATFTDVNGRSSTYRYDDPLGRMTDASFPDGGEVQMQYPTFSSLVRREKIDATRWKQMELAFDGFGREVSRRYSYPEKRDILKKTEYDDLGRIGKESNPYFEGDAAYDTWYEYDALGRVKYVHQPDGSLVKHNYEADPGSSLAVMVDTITDETGRQRRIYIDPFGRTIQVDEPAVNPTPPLQRNSSPGIRQFRAR